MGFLILIYPPLRCCLFLLGPGDTLHKTYFECLKVHFPPSQLHGEVLFVLFNSAIWSVLVCVVRPSAAILSDSGIGSVSEETANKCLLLRPSATLPLDLAQHIRMKTTKVQNGNMNEQINVVM